MQAALTSATRVDDNFVMSMRRDGEAERGHAATGPGEGAPGMHARDRSDDRKAEAMMRLAFAVPRSLGAEEPVEEPRQVRGLDLDAVVLHQHPHVARLLGAD